MNQSMILAIEARKFQTFFFFFFFVDVPTTLGLATAVLLEMQIELP